MVFVDILGVNAMVYAVVTGRIENILEPSGHFIDSLGMYPKLVKSLE